MTEEQHSRKKQWFLFAALILVALITRFASLSSVPQPINHDVASNGYDAWCLWETGMDRWGNSWPVHLEAFGQGDFRPALYTYLTIPFIAILGPDNITVATRCAASVVGVLSVLAFYWLICRLYDWKLASWAALLFVFSPWALQMGRFGHESSLTVLFPILILLTLSLAGFPLRRTDGEQAVRLSRFWMAAFGCVTGLSLYTYGSMRLFLPLFFIACTIIHFRELKLLLRDSRNRNSLVIGFILMVACSLPFIWQVATQWERINARAEEVSLFHQGKPFFVAIFNIFKQYILHYLPKFLFIRGDTFALNTLPGVGACNWIMLLLLPVGLYRLVRDRKDPLNLVLLAWFILFPIASATTTRAPHALRSALGVGVLIWIGLIGLDTLFQYCRTEKWRRTGFAIALVAILINGAWLMHCYFVRYERSPGFAAVLQNDHVKAMDYLQDKWKQYDRIFITDHFSREKLWVSYQPYIYALMYLPVEPQQFQLWEKDVWYKPPPLHHFHVMQQMGPITMSTRQEVLREFFQDFNPPPDQSALIISRPGDFGGMPKIHTIVDNQGAVRLEIFEYQPSNYK